MVSLRLLPQEPEPVAALVEAARGGDARAAEALYRRHAQRVRAVLLRILHVPADVDDLLQDTFARAFQKLGALREPDAFGAWVVAVAVGVARHHLRAKARRRWLSFFSPDALPEIEAPANSPEARDAARAAERVLRSFPVDERIAFALRFIEGMKLDEVAGAAGVSLATCKRRIARAEARFRAAASDDPALSPYLLAEPVGESPP